MKKILWMILLCWLIPTSFTASAANDLQRLIDETPVNGTLQLTKGDYTGPVIIAKPMTIIGEDGVRIISEKGGIVADKVDNVTLQNLYFETKLSPLKMLNGKNITVKDVQFLIADESVRFDNIDGLTLEHLHVFSESKKHFSQKPNGIDVFKSKNVDAIGLTITNLQDGIYFEHIENVSVTNTKSTFGRYGIHFMYGKQIDVRENTVTNNVTGLMLMIVQNIKVEHNTILRQLMINSNGLYLYDATNAIVRHNKFLENNVATVWNAVKGTTFSDNVFQANSTVIEAKKSPDVVVENNEMIGNILAARSDKQLFILRNNMYDDYSGYDFNRDGIGDTAHQTYTSFGQWMVRKPVYQYFIEAPSVVLLNKMDEQAKTPDMNALVDETPIMQKNSTTFKVNIQWIHLLLALLGIGLVYSIWRKLR